MSKYLKIDERIANYLLNIDEIDTRLRVYAEYQVPRITLNDLLMPVEMKQRLKLLTQKREAHLISATGREYQKMGKIVSEGEFSESNQS